MEKALKEVPFLVSSIKEGYVDQCYNAIVNSLDAELQKNKNNTKKEGTIGTRHASLVTDAYKQFLLYNMLDEHGGGKTPFLMVFKKEFMKDVAEKIVPLLPHYIQQDITWERLLIRGMKADKKVWSKLEKPEFIDSEKWNNVYEQIQKLKTKHHIQTEESSNQQNKLRETEISWYNFDDPIALHRFSTLSEDFNHIEDENIRINIDNSKEKNMKIKGRSDKKYDISIISSDLKGKIFISEKVTDKNNMKKSDNIIKNLFYKVNLPEDETLFILPNHLVIQNEKEVFSISMEPVPREKINDQIVYQYDKDGKPFELCELKDFRKIDNDTKVYASDLIGIDCTKQY